MSDESSSSSRDRDRLGRVQAEALGHRLQPLLRGVSGELLHPLLVFGLVGIDIDGAVQRVQGLGVVARLEVEIEEAGQDLRILRLAIGAVVKLGEVFDKGDAGLALGGQLRHVIHELAAATGLAEKLFEPAGQGQGALHPVKVQQSADDGVNGGKIGGGVALEQSPDKGLGLLHASHGQQGDGVGLARLLRTGGIGGQRLQ